jgi:hypothetical protein
MSVLQKITKRNFFIRLRNWEYWPFGILQFPLFIYFVWLALKARSLTFFTASNPGITMGGMFGESKYDVLSKIPAAYIPKTVLIKRPVTIGGVMNTFYSSGFTFPVIFKPDIGERGYMVKRIYNEQNAAEYLQSYPYDFMIQELVDLPLELGVFYTRFPEASAGRVTSVVLKEMLSVTGDGVSSLQQLILNLDRARLQWPVLKEKFKDRLHEVLPKGSALELVSIGTDATSSPPNFPPHLIASAKRLMDFISDDLTSVAKALSTCIPVRLRSWS